MPAAYILVALGIVIGAASVLAILVWRKALAERERERYFSDVRGLAHRRASTPADSGMPPHTYSSASTSRNRSWGGGATS